MRMFEGAGPSKDIGDWNTSKVESMHYMFYQASSFNQDIGGWDTTNVTSISGMFFSATTSRTSAAGTRKPPAS